MILNIKATKAAFALLAIGLAIAGCQKMTRPELKELITDPPPPPYADLKSFWSFENNLTDAGENKLSATAAAVTYVAGVTGQAAKIAAAGYILLKTFPDTVKYANGFKSLPKDTLSNLGSYTLSFWMNGIGPVKDGAQGLFSISNKTQFWGNLDLFLENYDNASDSGFLKVHMFNAAAASADNEQWNEIKIPKMLNKWTFIVVRYDASNSQFSIFSDNVAVISNKVLAAGKYGKLKFNDFNGMVLGTYQFQTVPSLTTNHGAESWAQSFHGALDQLRLYNRPLTNAELTDLFTTKK